LAVKRVAEAQMTAVLFIVWPDYATEDLPGTSLAVCHHLGQASERRHWHLIVGSILMLSL